MGVDGKQATVGDGTRNEVDDELFRSSGEVLHVGRGAGDVAMGRIVGWIVGTASHRVAVQDSWREAPWLALDVVKEAQEDVAGKL